MLSSICASRRSILACVKFRSRVLTDDDVGNVDPPEEGHRPSDVSAEQQGRNAAMPQCR
jgi:hypothetical protein